MIREVAILIDTECTWGRRIVAGIANAIRGVYPWRLIVAPRDEKWRLRVPNSWNGDALITSIRDPETAEHVQSLDLPVVNVSSWGRHLQWATRVITDDRQRARLAFDHFRSKGYQRFAFYAPPGQPHLQKRGIEFRELVRSHGFEFFEFLPNGDSPKNPGAKMPTTDEWVRQLPFPIAVLAANPQPALQLSEICRHAGIRIPHEVAILASDTDDLICEIADPPISSVELASELIGSQAVERLYAVLESGTQTPEITLVEPIRVIERLSTSALAIGDPLFEQAVGYLRDNAHTGINVSDVLKHVAISRRTLEQQFASVLGISPAAEIRRIRIEHVKKLLTDSDLTISQISKQTGFSTPNRLSELFRNEVGMTPNEYRDYFH